VDESKKPEFGTGTPPSRFTGTPPIIATVACISEAFGCLISIPGIGHLVAVKWKSAIAIFLFYHLLQAICFGLGLVLALQCGYDARTVIGVIVLPLVRGILYLVFLVASPFSAYHAAHNTLMWDPSVREQWLCRFGLIAGTQQEIGKGSKTIMEMLTPLLTTLDKSWLVLSTVWVVAWMIFEYIWWSTAPDWSVDPIGTNVFKAFICTLILYFLYHFGRRR